MNQEKLKAGMVVRDSGQFPQYQGRFRINAVSREGSVMLESLSNGQHVAISAGNLCNSWKEVEMPPPAASGRASGRHTTPR